MRRKRIPKVVPFSPHGPQNGPKMGSNIDIFGAYFWIPFLLGFGALWVPLGSLLGPPKALLGGSCTPKTFKNWRFFKVFANATFSVFGVFDVPLGYILAPSWPDLVPKWIPKWPQKWSKKCSKTGPKNDPPKSIFWANFGPQNGPPNWSKSLRRGTAIFGRGFLKRSWSQDAPKMAQDGPK